MSFPSCPKCDFALSTEDNPQRCPRCNFSFAGWESIPKPTPALDAAEILIYENQNASSFLASIKQALFFVPENVDRAQWWGRVLIFCIFLIWGLHFISMDFQSNEIGQSFMHNVNLVFHEAGHVLFNPFGRFLHILGGSLFQVLVPLICLGTFLLKTKDPFGASIALWWTGQSLMDLAPYIADARALELMLLGGGTGQDLPGMHDWQNLLTSLGLLQYDIQIARLTDYSGSLTMIIAFVWGFCVLRKQKEKLA